MRTLQRLNKNRKSPSNRSLAFTLGGAAILIIGGLLAFFLLNSRQSNSALPLGSTVLPQDTLLSLTVGTDGGTWQRLGQFGTADSQASWTNTLKQFETDFLQPFGLTYADDVRPWIGGQATMAYLSPAAADVATVGDRATVWMLPVSNLGRVQEMLNKAGRGGVPQKRNYKEVEIQEFQGANGKKLAALILQNKLLIVTDGSNTINSVVDTYRGQPSLAQLPRFQDAMGTIESSRAWGQLYMNLPIASAGLVERSGANISKNAVERLQNVQGMGSAIHVEEAGIRFDGISWLKPDAKIKLNAANKPQSMMQSLPQDTLMALTGGDFQQVWQDYTQGSESQLVIPFRPQQIQSGLQKALGIDFEKEFIPWMNNEFSISLIPASNDKKQGVGISVLAKASDRNKADEALKKLDIAVRDRYNLLISEAKVGNRTVINWQVPPNIPLATRGWLDNNVAFFTFGAPITERVVKPPEGALSKTDLFQKTVPTELKPNTGEFYVDMTRTSALLQNSPLLPKLSPTANKFAQGIEGIGVTTAIPNDWSSRYKVFVKLKR
jgi:hypothetical protein